MSEKEDSFSSAIKKSSLITGIFILQEGAVTLLPESERSGVMILGLLLAFMTLVLTIFAILASTALKFKLKWNGVMESAAPAISVFVISDIIVALLPAENKSLVLVYGMFLGFIAYALILIGRLLFEILNVKSETIKSLSLTPDVGLKMKEQRWTHYDPEK